MKYSLKEIAAAVGGEARGDDVHLTGVAAFMIATAEHLIFIEDPKHLANALASKAGAIIVPASVLTVLEAMRSASSKPLLIHNNPRLAFARAAGMLADPPEFTLGVHATAIVHGDAQLGLGTSVGPHAVIERGAKIGGRTRIGSGCVISADVTIGDGCILHSRVTCYSGTSIGDHVTVHSGTVLGSDGFGFVRDPASGSYEKFPQIGRLIIEDDVEIGANCTIDRGALDATTIGRGTKLDNMVHVGHNVIIGKNVVIAAQTGISGSSRIGDGAIIGGQVGIADHVTIEDGVILGAQCGVPSGKIIRGAGTVYWGTPARPLKNVLKELAAVAKLAKK